jgi:basic membrane protein A and related proteins
LSYDFGRPSGCAPAAVDFCVSGWDKFNSSRRKALKRMALLGAASLVPANFPARAARTAGLTAGFVYIGPRKDWGWNESYAVAATRGIPHVGVVEAGYLPETTDYGSGKETPGTKAYAEQTNYLIEGVIGSIT